jgi:SH3 domain protein
MRRRTLQRTIPPSTGDVAYKPGEKDVKPFIVVVGLLILFGSELALAAPRYVIDELQITMRSGRSNQHSILKLLKSGDKVELLEEVEENNRTYAHVRFGNLDGWVHAQYLSAEPIARDRLANAEQRLQKVRAENTQLKTQLSELNEVRDEASQLKKELEQLRVAAADPIRTQRQNEQLRSELTTLKHEHELLKNEYEQVTGNEQRDWFIAGAGVVIVSIIFGILLTKIRLRKRSSWGEL